jgi:predicted TIM-barrel fold metal-dependent hydrolase
VVRVDVHQHLFPPALIEALARRATPPRARLEHGTWFVQAPGDAPWPVPAGAGDAHARLAALAEDGVDRALVAPSTPLGMELLAPDEAHALLDAHRAGLGELPGAFGTWAGIAVRDPDAGEAAARALDAGAAGVVVPAQALATPPALERLGPVLAVLEAREAPLLVHPGPAESVPGTPWWPALTGYVAQQHAAWHAWLAAGRPAHPRLRVCFALLAGLAPLHAERLAARGGPSTGAADPLVFYETSSYGPRAVTAMREAVGLAQLVHGSDRPMCTPRRSACRQPSWPPSPRPPPRASWEPRDQRLHPRPHRPRPRARRRRGGLGAPRPPRPGAAPVPPAPRGRRVDRLARVLAARAGHGLPRP